MVATTKKQEQKRLFAQYTLATKAFRYFLPFVRITESGSGVIPLEMWPHIGEMVDDLEMERLLVWAKPRQISATTILSTYALWHAQFVPNGEVLNISKGERESHEFLSKSKEVWTNLPEPLKAERCLPDNQGRMTFTHGGKIDALPSTADAGRGRNPTLVIFDEGDFHEYLEEAINSVKPGLDDRGGQLVMASTWSPYKVGSLFQRTYQNPGNGYKKRFWPFNVRPGRTEDWYQARKSEAEDPALFEKEFPRCLAPDTLISTERGIVPISEASNAFRSGHGLLYHLKTDRGRELFATKEHPILTPSGEGEYWELGELQVGDEICLKSPTFAESLADIDIPSDTYGETRTLVVDRRWARFLGIFVADGSLGGRYHSTKGTAAAKLSIAFDSRDTDLISQTQKDVETLFKVDTTVRRVSSGGSELRCSISHARPVLEALGVVRGSGETEQAQRKVIVPPAIFRSPKNIVREFLAGVFEGDGGVYTSPNKAGKNAGTKVTLASKHEDFLRQIQFLLLGFGITSRVSVQDKVSQKGEIYPCRVLNLYKAEALKFKEELKFLSNRKQSVLESISPVPHPTGRHPSPIRLVDTVKSIWPAHESELWDATTSEHCFSAVGIWVHNSEEEMMAPANAMAFFDLPTIRAMQVDCKEPIEVVTVGNGVQANIWQYMQEGKRYTAATDTSHGAGKDYAVTIVKDVTTGYTVADIYSSVIDATELGVASVELLNRYDSPIWAIEDNDWGILTLRIAQELRYKRIYYRDEDGEKPGWHTFDTASHAAEGSRFVMLGDLYRAVKSRLVTIPNKAGLAQFMTMIRNPKKNGRVEAQEGAHDDYVMAEAIAWQLRSQSRPAASQRGRSNPDAGFRTRRRRGGRYSWAGQGR